MDFAGLITLLYYYIYAYRYEMVDPSLDVIDVGAHINQSYDFIIVGAGTAGCVIANRLTEISNWNVLLIEAGGFPPIVGKIPLISSLAKTENYYTTNQEKACQSSHGICKWPQGRGLGGSTLVNAQIYLRSTKGDVDNWESLGCKGWAYKSVLPYYKLSERNLNYGGQYHNKCGLWQVENMAYSSPLAAAYIEAGNSVGLQITDLNGAEPNGIMNTQSTVDNGERENTYKAFIKPIRSRNNLHVSINSTVERILFNDNKAIGVKFKKRGRSFTIYADKEVIVCAGAIGSPQLLMLSGIGPSDHLKSLGIQVVKNLPVGKNLQDHLNVPLAFKNKITSGIKFNEEDIKSYVKNPSGGRLTNVGVEAVARLNFTSLEPDVTMTFNSANEDLPESFVFNVCVSKPDSTGTILLNTTNIFDHPIIDPKYFTAEKDIRLSLLGLWKAYKMATSRPMERFNSTINVEYYDKYCPGYVIPSDEFFKCVMKYYSSTSFHPVGCCRMGSEHDPGSVVTPRLRVLGVENIRVIDSSIFPVITRSNTQAPTVMVAEKGADMIKADHFKPTHIAG